jgi:hypothetical protein
MTRILVSSAKNKCEFGDIIEASLWATLKEQNDVVSAY